MGSILKSSLLKVFLFWITYFSFSSLVFALPAHQQRLLAPDALLLKPWAYQPIVALTQKNMQAIKAPAPHKKKPVIMVGNKVLLAGTTDRANAILDKAVNLKGVNEAKSVEHRDQDIVLIGG